VAPSREPSSTRPSVSLSAYSWLRQETSDPRRVTELRTAVTKVPGFHAAVEALKGLAYEEIIASHPHFVAQAPTTPSHAGPPAWT
jgi:hypothetical protein